MESKDGLKEIHGKNCTCYYFDDAMAVLILVDEKLLHIRFDKIYGFIKVYDELDIGCMIKFIIGLDIL